MHGTTPALAGRMRSLWRVLVVVLVGCEGALLGGGEAPASESPFRPSPAVEPAPGSPSTPSPGVPPAPTEPEPPFRCQPGLTASEPLQRLTREQYRLALTGLVDAAALASVEAELAALPPDVLGQALEASDRAWAFAEPQVLLFNAVARTLGDTVAATPQSLDSCLSSPAPDQPCLERSLGGFAARAWRRPLSRAEVDALVSVYRLGTTRAFGLSAVVRFVLQSPDFLYRLEAPRRADRLALLLWDAPPDTVLSAAEPRLATSTAREAEVRRALAHPLARQKLERFFRFWLRLDAAGAAPVGPPSFVAGVETSGLRTAAIDETLQFLSRLTFDERGGYTQMMTSRRSFASHPGLARLYGHAPVAAGAVAMMGGTRQGVLMRLPFLLHGDGETHPIVRGAATRRRLLCQPIALPAPDNFSSGPDVNTLQMRQTLSTRQRTDLKTGQGSCAACHTSINPLGFAFESLDALGRERDTEVQFHADGGVLASHRIDDRVELTSRTGALVPRQGVAGLSQHLAESIEGPACFVQFLFEFYRRQHRMGAEEDGNRRQRPPTGSPLGTLGGTEVSNCPSLSASRKAMTSSASRGENPRTRASAGSSWRFTRA